MEYEVAIDQELEKEIDVLVAASELEPIIDQEVNKLQKELAIKGFRKGRVPTSLIKTRYHDTLKAQALEQLIADSYLKILQDKKWRPASNPKLLNIEEGDKIKFRLQFEVIPEFTVENYHNVEVFKGDALPDEFLLEQGLKDLRARYATVKEVTRPIVVDDFVTMDLEIRNKDKTQEKKENVTVRVGDRGLPDEVNRVLVGAHKSEHKETVAGDLVYKMFIRKIEEQEMPQIDDHFAKSVKYESVEKLKTALMEDLKKAEAMRLEDEIKESLSKVLLERIHISIPKSLIQREYDKTLQRAQLPDSDANKERFWDIAQKRVRFNLILEKIAEKENIHATEEEIATAIESIGINLTDENRNDVIAYMSDVLNREKTIDFLYKNAKISEKSRIISPKEATNDTRTVRH